MCWGIAGITITQIEPVLAPSAYLSFSTFIYSVLSAVFKIKSIFHNKVQYVAWKEIPKKSDNVIK